MKIEDIQAAFAALDDQHPFYLALTELLNMAITDEMESTARCDLTDGARHFNAGRLAQAIDFGELIRRTKEHAAAAQEAENFKAAQKAAREQ